MTATQEKYSFIRQILSSHLSNELRRISSQYQLASHPEGRITALEEVIAWHVLAGELETVTTLLQELRATVPLSVDALPSATLEPATRAIASGRDPLRLAWAMADAVTHSPMLAYTLQHYSVDLQHLGSEDMQVLLYTAALPGLEHLLAFQNYEREQESRAQHA